MRYHRLRRAAMPAIGFGTWELRGEACADAVREALGAGYRHLDTAQSYENEEHVGRAIREVGVPRDELFLTTKIRPANLSYENVLRTTEESLSKLGTPHVDLLLVHWPNPSIALEETLAAMQEIERRGMANHIGVSNFPPSLVERATEIVDISCNQVEYHPYLTQADLLARARALHFVLTAYSPLAKGRVARDPLLIDIGRRHGKSPAQVALRWLVQQPEVAAIPKTSNPARIRENIAIFDFELTTEEMAAVHGLARLDGRLVDPDWVTSWA